MRRATRRVTRRTPRAAVSAAARSSAAVQAWHGGAVAPAWSGGAVARGGRRVRRRARRSAMTSPSIRRSVSPAARAAATACCSTSAIRRTRCASTPPPTRTSRSGIRRRSATTARRCCSATNGAAARSRAAASTDKMRVGRRRHLHAGQRQDGHQGLLQDAGGADVEENCVAHNGSLIPIPGRDIMVQGWYQGGVSVFDWTDPAHPNEIAYFDRGPIDSTRLVSGGSWSVYWYNGYIVQLRDRARSRHLRAEAERVPLAERDRCGEDGALRLSERAGSAEVRLAGDVRPVARLPRSARAQQRSVGRSSGRDPQDAQRRGRRRAPTSARRI